MSQGERQPVAGTIISPPTAERAGSSARRADAAPDWESLFPTLLPQQQQSLLALAMQQGCLHADQIPSADDKSADRTRVFFTAILQNQASEVLAAFQPKPIAALDLELDAAQRAAVAVAIQTPDLTVIRGLPGAGKSRVIVEIVRQAVRSGQRVLVVAATPAALDFVLERVQDDGSVRPCRILSRDERADQLPPCTANRTLSAYRRQLTEEPIRHVRLAVQRSEAAIARWRADLVVLERLTPVAEQYQRSLAQHSSHSDRLLHLADEVEHGADDSFAAQLRRQTSEQELSLEQKDREIASAMARLNDLHKQVADAEARLAAAEHAQCERGLLNRFLGIGAGRLQSQIDEAKNHLTAIRLQREQLAEDCRRQSEEREAVARQWETARHESIAAETNKRRAEFEQQLAATSHQIDEIKHRCLQMAQGLLSTCVQADAISPDLVEQAKNSIRESIERESHEVAFARRWCDYLAGNAEQLLARLQKKFNAVLATPAAVQTDERLAELAKDNRFDLVVVDEAHLLSENELWPVLRLASRWALVGEPGPETLSGEIGAWHANGRGHRSAPHRQAGASAGRIRSSSTSARPNIWHRLCHGLEHDVWSYQDDRLCCRLRPIAHSQRAELEIETVADSPDIELHILTPDGGAPTLVEVLFPSSTTIDQALQYLYCELNEVPVPNTLPTWDRSGGRFIARFADAASSSEVELEKGLRLQLNKNGQTVGVDFDIDSGWDQERAANWLHEHTQSIDSGRLVDLTVSFRMYPELARLVSSIWFEDRFRIAAGSGQPVPQAVEFVAVSAEGSRLHRRQEHGPNGTVMRGGLETDLSDARQREHLTREFPGTVPPRGLVNLSEGRAIISLLEERSIDVANEFGGKPASVAILTLHAAQAELIRTLLRQSPALARPSIPLFVGHASEFRQREADLVILSLARSHERRTVSYADDPALIALAVTRARRRLVLVGDPGMLARRAQWDGPLDHLDEFAADREKGWASALFSRLHELSRLAAPSLEGVS